MVYLFAIIGFFVGFAFGLMVLGFVLRHKSTKELLHDDSLKWTFGLLNWAIAVAGAYIFVKFYQEYVELSM